MSLETSAIEIRRSLKDLERRLATAAAVADASEAHTLDDTTLATLRADSEAALDALGAKINAILGLLRNAEVINS